MYTVIGTVNFGRDDSKAHHLAQMQKVAAAFKDHARVWLFIQEIMEGDKYNERRMMLDVFHDYDVAGLHTMTPILTKGWDITHSDTKFSTPGIAHVTPTRFIVAARGRMSSNHDIKLGGVNMHPIQGAFTDPGQVYEKKRDLYFKKNWADSTKRTLRFNSHNVTSVRGGDINDPFVPTNLLPGENVLLHQSLDQLFDRQVRHGSKLHVESRGSVNIDIDGHNCQYVVADMKAA